MKKIAKIATCLVLICCFALSFAACSAKAVTVTINDSGTKTEVEATTGMTVSEAVEKGGLSLGEKDETTPEKDEKITEDTTEITIKRYAKVTVVKGTEKKEVELVGGTVEEAVKKAGFTLGANDALDADKSAYLKDGMTITITAALKITLTVDGKTTEVSTSAKDVKSFLDEQKIKLGKDDTVSEKLETPLKNGMKIVVKRVEFKEEKKTEEIDYESEKEYDDSMNEGESKVTQQGVKGEKEVVYTVKYVDGKEESREKKSEKTTKNPVDEITTYGTKSDAPQDNGSNEAAQSNNNSADNKPAESESKAEQGGKTVVSKTPIYDCDGSGHGYYEIKYSDGSVERQDF